MWTQINRPYALMSRLHNNDAMLGVKTCRAARTCCAGRAVGALSLSGSTRAPGRPGGMACRGWPAACMLGDGARDSASFDPQHAGAPFCDVICISIRCSYTCNWAGLDHQGRMHESHLSFRSHEQNALVSSFTTIKINYIYADSTSVLNKMWMVIVRNAFAWNNNVNMALIQRHTKQRIIQNVNALYISWCHFHALQGYMHLTPIEAKGESPHSHIR